jgi:uncharacterized protein (TIGR03067 family)
MGDLEMKGWMSMACVLLAVTACANSSIESVSIESARRDKDLIQGKWHLVSVIIEEKEEDVSDVFAISLIFAGDQYETEWISNGTVEKASKDEPRFRFKLDPHVTPRRIDHFLVLPGFFDETLIEEGIYKLKGDELWIAFPNPSWGRPTDFTGRATEKGEVQVWHLKKERRK